MGVLGVAFQDHQVLVIEDEVGALVKGREDAQRAVEFLGEAASAHVTLGGLLFLLSAGFSLIFGLMRVPNLEEIFTQLVQQDDMETRARDIAELIAKRS